ncbi:unnamed protein product [Prorocentrum cordatum]|uniref:Uncharacterized protein n=1 Tax=Prorocentrum cordatum TaxID=2364126 RepID=A0ABN9T572_9DINO|nr:unnamed protein product [Polarella glacialis]
MSRFPECLTELVAATFQEWRWVRRRLLCLLMFFLWLYTLVDHYAPNASRESWILLIVTACLMQISVSERFHKGIQMIWNTPHRWLYFQLFFLFALLVYMVSLRALGPELWEGIAERRPLLVGLWKLHSVVHDSFVGVPLRVRGRAGGTGLREPASATGGVAGTRASSGGSAASSLVRAAGSLRQLSPAASTLSLRQLSSASLLRLDQAGSPAGSSRQSRLDPADGPLLRPASAASLGGQGTAGAGLAGRGGRQDVAAVAAPESPLPELWLDGASASSASGSSEEAIAQHSPHAFVQGTEALDRQKLNQLEQHFFIMTEEELASCMGLSGQCIVANGPLEILSLWVVSAQALCLQFAVLYGMWMCVAPASHCVDDPAGSTHNVGIITPIAVYLHFINVIGDIPFAVSIAAHFFHLRRTWQEVLLSAPIFLVDAFIVPTSTAVIGALFLCTSLTVKDLLLNSVAVAFVNGGASTIGFWSSA